MTHALPRRLARALTATALFAVALGHAPRAVAADCDVDVWQAYQTAKARGWAFYCLPAPGLSGGFVTYPGQNIGCALRTPAVMMGGASGDAQFFEANPAGTGFHNGWSLGTVEFSGAQWQRLANPRSRILARAVGLTKTGHVYNFRLTRLVLKKTGGSCSKAVDEAF